MTAGAAPLAKLGFAQGQVIQEFGYADDADDGVRLAIEQLVGGELEDEDFNEGADGVLVWFRDGDEDLGDLLIDGLTNLFDQGFVVLMTPKSGQDGHVEASEIEEAASTAGLQTGGAVNVAPAWTAMRLMSPRGPRR